MGNIWKMFMLVTILLLGVGMVSALELDNSKSIIDITKGQQLTIGDKELAYNPLWEKYEPIEIKNAFGLGETLLQGAITNNTETCLNDCSAVMELYLANKGSLIDDIRFYTIKDGSRTEQPIRSYKIYVDGNPYNLGDEVEPGTYEIRLEGNKRADRTVDWQIKTNGIWTTDWAYWRSVAIVYDNFNDASINYTRWGNRSTTNGPAAATATLAESGGYLKSEVSVANTGTGYALVDVWNNRTEINATNMYFLNITSYNKVCQTSAVGTTGKVYFKLFESLVHTAQGGPANCVPTYPNVTILAYRNASNSSLFDYYVYNINGYALLSSGTLKPNSSYINITTECAGSGDGLGACSAYSYVDNVDWSPWLGYVTLNSPANNAQYIAGNVTFNCSAQTDGTATLVNISLMTNQGGTLAIVQNVSKTGTSNSTTFVQNFTNGDYIWNCQACDSDGVCGVSIPNRNIAIKNIAINNVTYNATTFETSYENFAVNLTTDTNLTNVNLVYQGTSYAATNLGGGLWSRSINIPTVTASTSYGFYWNFIYTGSSLNSSTYNQTVNPILLTICNSTTNVAYINFTFKDETAGTFINSTLNPASFTYSIGTGLAESYIYTNLSNNIKSYAFCFSPSYKPINTAFSIKYLFTNYPLRTYYYSGTLSNTTTNTVLYSLPSTDGIYSAIRTAESSGGVITGVTIQYERQIGGVWTLMGQELTGDDGVATFWVNPNYQYRFTASKTGYTSVQVVIQPSQSQYTITMSTGATGAYSSEIAGVLWYAYPSSGSIKPKANQVFNATIISTNSNLVACKLELLNASDITQVFGSSTTPGLTNSSYCYLTYSYTTKEDIDIFMRLSVQTTNSTGYIILDSDYKYVVIDVDVKGWSTITSFFVDLKSLNEFGNTTNEAEFSQIVLFFIVLTMLIGVFTYFSGVELSTPGVSLIILFVVIWIASVAGFLSFNSGSEQLSPWIEQYGFAFIFTIQIIGYVLGLFRRTGE